MGPRPEIFVSAVSKELKAARQLVSNTLQLLGYEPVWQDIFGTEQGDLRAMLRQKIDECKGVIQLVGRCYGAEPRSPDDLFGRVSYTQYEALYARQRGKKVWYLFLDEGFPRDLAAPEPAELQELQATYLRKLRADSHLRYTLSSSEALEASVLKMRDELTRLRRGVKQWAVAVLVLLVVLIGAAIWIKSEQRKQTIAQEEQNRQLAAIKEEMVKLHEAVTQFPEVQGRIRQDQQQRGQNIAEVQQRTYEELGKQLGLDPKLLEEKLPQFARELQRAPDTTTYDRANAAYVNKDYVEAERLALAAVHEAQIASPQKTGDIIRALELAGHSAEVRIEYADALRHYRDAESLTDRGRDYLEWGHQQWNIAFVLQKEGQYSEAKKVYQGVLAEYRSMRGEQDVDVLMLRNNLADALISQGQYADAEKECRDALAIEERVLGPEDRDTLYTRSNLANALIYEGRYADAEKEHKDVLAIEERVLGPENRDTLVTRNNIAIELTAQGQYADAEKEFLNALAIEERVLGPEDPDTLSARSDLAEALISRDRYADAEKECRDILTIDERVLGPEHPDTLYTRDNLATALRGEGRYADAEKEYRDVLAIRERVLGAEHPDTCVAEEGLARTSLAQGKFDEAEKEYRDVLAIREQMLGVGHPTTLADRNNLAWCQLLVKDFTGALATTEVGLKAKAPDLHLETNHAHALLFIGRTDEAEQIYIRYRGQKMNANSKKTWEEAILGDFDDLEKAGLTNPEMARIRVLFRPEAK